MTDYTDLCKRLRDIRVTHSESAFATSITHDAADAIEALQAENTRIIRVMNGAAQTQDRNIATRIVELEAENAALRADAKRWRWTKNNAIIGYSGQNVPHYKAMLIFNRPWQEVVFLDEFVDAAIAAQEKKP